MHKSIRPEATHVYLLSFWDLAGLFSKVESKFFFLSYAFKRNVCFHENCLQNWMKIQTALAVLCYSS